ncbi:cation channel sperm-associated auxiliary subunit delta-like [Glandiceps talaboti]
MPYLPKNQTFPNFGMIIEPSRPRNFQKYPNPVNSAISVYKVSLQDTGLVSGYEYLQYHGQKTIVRNHCNNLIALFLNSQIYVTKDGFQTETEALSMSSLLEGGSPIVLSVAFLNKSTVLLVINSRLYSYSIETQEYYWIRLSGNVTTVHTATHCQGLYNIVAVTNNAKKHQITVINDIYNVNEIQVSVPYPEHDIFGIAVVPTYSALTILTRVDEQTAKFVLVDLFSDVSITNTTQGIPFTIHGDVHFTAFRKPCEDLLLWDSNGLYFSFTAGQTVLPVTVSGTKDTDMDIHQVITVFKLVPSTSYCSCHTFCFFKGNHGEYVVMTTDGQLLFGRHWQASLVASNLTLTDDTALTFDPEGNVQFIEMDAQTGLPCIRDMLTPNNKPLDICQLLEQTLEEDHLYYLDTRTSLNLTVTLITKPWLDNHLLISVSQPSLVISQTIVHRDEVIGSGIVAKRQVCEQCPKWQTLVHSDEVIGNGIVAKKQTFELTAASSSVASSIFTNFISIRATAVYSGLSCKVTPELVTDVAIGCPPAHNIRVRNKPDQCNEKVTEFAVSSGDSVVMVKYNYTKWGCPVQVYYTDNFQPIIDLYDGEDFMEKVTVDYVVQEEFNRTVANYKLTPRTAGCIAEPQTWMSMLTNTSDPDLAWTRDNYESCMNQDRADRVGPPRPRQQYEVLSSANGNSLSWAHNSYYVYTVTVLDPQFSFCQLRTKFAVRVHGVLSETTHIITIPVTCVIVCVFVSIFYVVSEKLMKKSDDKKE